MDHFEVFGLPRRLAIDRAALERRFYELSRRYHPDFHQAAPPAEQARVLEASARLNAAYRALRDPIARVEYLVRLEEGKETKEGNQTREGAADKPTAPPELLEEMFEIQEALAEAKAGGLDEAQRAALGAQRDRLAARLREEEARLVGPLSQQWDASPPTERRRALEAMKASLAARAYLRTVLDDLNGALGEGEEGYVANRWH